MGIGKRKFSRHIKTLLHFDYPYFGEPGDGLRDEIQVLEWNYSGSAKLVGAEIPVDTVVSGTPKFGHRCLQSTTTSDYIQSDCSSDYLKIKASGDYEFTFFIRLDSAYAGNVVDILNESNTSIFKIGISSSNYITLTSSTLGLNLTAGTAIATTTWTHIRVRLTEGKGYIYVNGSQSGTQTMTSGAVINTIARIRVGGFNGQLDEFMIRDNLSSSVTVPAAPYRGAISLRGIGGTGRHGALSLTSGSSRLNTVYKISSITSTSKFTVTTLNLDSTSVGIHGQAAVGDEVMIIKWQTERNAKINNTTQTDSGLYAMRRIKAISGTEFTLDSAITEFPFENDSNYHYGVYLVPEYTSVNIASGATVIPRKESSVTANEVTAGLVVFRCKGNVTIDGKITTTGYGPHRGDWFQMTHNHLPERFIYGKGGGVIILSEGLVKISENARIGGTWSGAGKGGTGGSSSAGGNAGAGYGGGGASFPYSSTAATYSGMSDNTGGKGGVGGGGSSTVATTSPSKAIYKGQDAGYAWGGGVRGTGGQHTAVTNKVGHAANQSALYHDLNHPGGTQGLTMGMSFVGGMGAVMSAATSNSNGSLVSACGACVMIICKKINIAQAALSTGGSGGKYNTTMGTVHSGGGTGVCYLAYEEAE